MSRLAILFRALALASLLTTLVGCQAIFGDFKVDDSAFAGAGNVGQGGAGGSGAGGNGAGGNGAGGSGPAQSGPIRIALNTGLYTTEWGGQATFTIVLEQEPTSSVTVALVSSNTTEGTVTPTSVTFTKDDWKAPQVITVTGEDDTIPDLNRAYKVITEPAVSDDPSFNGVDPIDIDLINIDNETAGITVVPRMGLVTTEAGGQDTFTVVLNSKPEQDVTISLTSSTPKEGTVNPESLSFTALNWMAPQLVTVTGVDDEEKDQGRPYTISVATTSEDQNYARIAPVTVEVINKDNESAGVTVALVTGVDPIDPTKLRTSESGDSATFTVVLNAPPTADVTMDVLSSVDVEGEVSPGGLTFTPLNWNAPQTVTVTGKEDDGIADGDQPYKVLVAAPTSADPDYEALIETEVPVSNVDNDKPGFTLTLLTGIDPVDPTKLRTTEAGGTATFSLALNSKPSHPVKIAAVTSSLPTEGFVSPTSLTFTTANWNAPQIVSVRGVNDNLQDGSPLFYVRTVAATSDDPGYALDPPDVQVTNQDDDSADLHIALGNGIDPLNPGKLVTDETGSTATFTVVLTSQPTADVTVPISSSNTREGTVSRSSLRFTPANYGAPQSVTVTGISDKIIDGNQPFVIAIGTASSSDANYNGKFNPQVQVINRDIDSAAVIVNPTTGLTTGENATTASFTMRLQSQPKADVTVAISSSNAAEGRPNVSSVRFTPVNWNANQTITVTGQNDDVQDGHQPYRIIINPPASQDQDYNGKPNPPDVNLTNTDNDTAGFTVRPTTGLVTNEDGGKATFTIELTAKPINTSSPGSAANVRVTLINSSKPSEGTVSPASLTFTDVNWRSPQTVTVTGVDDLSADGPQPYLITMGLAQSTDANYNAKKPDDVSVTNYDNDTAAIEIQPAPTQIPADTSEKMGTSTFTVRLTSLPRSDVTFAVSSSDITEGRVSPAMLRFTTANWSTPQVVTVTGVDDEVADGDQEYKVRLGNAVSTDANYGGKLGTELPFRNTDDDQPQYDIVAVSTLKTTELNTGTATFTVALRSQPIASVNIGVTSSNTSEGTVSPAMLTFTTSNWLTPQTVTVTGVQDEVADGPQTYQVRLGNASSTDPSYGGKFGTQLAAENADDDTPGFVVSAATMLQTTEKAGKAIFTVVLKSKPAGTATVTLPVSSNNTKEGTVLPASLVFTGANWNQPHTVTVTGIDDNKADGPVSYQIVFGAPAGTDMTYLNEPPPEAVPLTNIDDDNVGVLVSSTTCSTTTGTTATFTIQLTSQPSANVTIPLTSDTPAMATVLPESVLFTPTGAGSWDTPQIVTVTGVSDGSYQIITGEAVATGETTGYNGFASVADDVSCTNTTTLPPP